MHPAPGFHWEDQAALGNFADAIGFGMLIGQTPAGLRVAHLPFVPIGADRLRFHLARTNALTPHLAGQQAIFVVNGPDGYISPDWYGLPNQVPTWNYLAAEFEGPVTPLDTADLLAQIDALSTRHEARLAPKTPWTRAKMDPAMMAQLLAGICGFEMQITAWRGTAKLGQNKPDQARHGAADAVEAAGNPALAAWMRALPQ